jgi:hypothetical protein
VVFAVLMKKLPDVLRKKSGIFSALACLEGIAGISLTASRVLRGRGEDGE